MSSRTITSPTQGIVGYLHEMEYDKDSILVFQLPRATNMLSEVYIAGAVKSLRDILPDGKKAIVVGCDVNVYQIAGIEATALILKGII
jgi:hypothetical protein